MSYKKKYNLGDILDYLEKVLHEKKSKNKNFSYTEKLLTGDLKKVIQKVGEESVEVSIEATLKNKKRTIYESADLIFHLLVMWNRLDIKIEEIAEELERRKKDWVTADLIREEIKDRGWIVEDTKDGQRLKLK